MGIMEIKGKKILAGPGTSWIAEALVKDAEGKERYVTVHYYDGEYYSVAEKSIYDFFEDDDCEPIDSLEEYDNYEDAKKSAYKKIFGQLRKVIDMLD